MRNINLDTRDVIFLDIDGTLVEHNYNPDIHPEHYLNTTLAYLMANLDKAVVLTTSRSAGHVLKVKRFLEANNVNVIGIVSSIPTGKRILINDHKPGDEPKAIAINCLRDVGVEDVGRT